MKKSVWKILACLGACIVAFLYYYVTLPAFNIHSAGTWMFLMGAVIVIVALGSIKNLKGVKVEKNGQIVLDKLMFKGEFYKITFGILGILVAIFFLGSLLSSPIINAGKYQALITVETKEFTEDIKEVDYSQIPLLDKSSAALLGNRKMGSMVEYVSQFEVSEMYTQINYQGIPTRVTPLVYASPIKWLTNQSAGIPAYIKIDMTTQETECVKLEEPIRYSHSEYFGRNIYRHLRFNYPTYIFDTLSFEVDDEGTPYWICPVKEFKIGLFGGQVIGKVVLCNASTGELTAYEVEDVPSWVDHVYSANLLINLYDYHGTLKHGYFNSVLGQKDCLQTTTGYNYIAMDDDVWVYTGITSVAGDQSNVGFVLMNQRTMETRYYACEGAEEYSAMSSAEGQVQNLGYHATFPLLLNIGDEPTYFLALKDDAGLVKKYAMVNIQRYQIVATGDSVAECETNYQNLLYQNNISKQEVETGEVKTGTIAKIATGTIDGNTHYYLMLENETEIYDVLLSDFITVVRYDVGDRIELEYVTAGDVNKVVAIKE